MKALGTIETVGLIAAVEAGDVALKTADIKIIGSQAVGGGLVSILMTGDVSAVKAAIDAGSAAAAQVGEVCSVTVIARPAEGLEKILLDETKRLMFSPQRQTPVQAEPEVIREPVAELEVPDQKIDAKDHDSTETDVADLLSIDLAELKKMKVTELRRLAQQLPTLSRPQGEIDFASKKDLLQAFNSYMKTIKK